MAGKEKKGAFRKKIGALFNKQTVKTFIVPLLVMGISSIVTVIFSVLCMANFKDGFLAKHATVITSLLLGLEVIYIIAMSICFARKFQAVYKLLMTGIVIASVIVLALYIVQVTGVLEYVDTVDELRDIIESVGSWWAPVLFIVLQILQVCLLPIPGVLTVGAGVLAFGPELACIYSYVGIIIGSLISFWIGRVLGYRVAAWIAGKETLDKWLQKIKGRDRMLLTAMFLLPLFPDDVLCIVSGLTTMSWLYFIVMQLITRAVSVVTTAFSLNGDIIPYDTLWGIIVWICIGIAIIALFILIWKKGEQFEKWFFSLFRSKKGKGLSLSASVDAAETADKNGKEKGNAPAADQPDSPGGETENTAVGRGAPEKGCGSDAAQGDAASPPKSENDREEDP